MRKMCIGTYFTSGWCYSVDSWLNNLIPAISGFSGSIAVSTDKSDECLNKFEKIKTSCKAVGWDAYSIISDIKTDKHEAYKKEAQLIIATLQQKAFGFAREIGADFFWSVESDILVPPNSLKVLLQALEFDDNYYSIGMVTYPNGQFLGGRGTPTRHICEDIYEDEREISGDLMEKIEKRKKKIEELSKDRKEPSKSLIEDWQNLDEEIKKCKPKGNIFELQSKGWRKRGWMDSAYPAIGRGALLPTDWVGLGCTLINKKALSLATFDGYELNGTQDLFLCWKRWHPEGLNMCVIPHILCSHVKRKLNKDRHRTEEVEIFEAYHEQSGECAGHLRQRTGKYINFNL